MSDAIIVDTTSTGRIAGIEILGASSRIDLKTILSYSVDVDKSISALTSRYVAGIGGGIGEADPAGSTRS